MATNSPKPKPDKPKPKPQEQKTADAKKSTINKKLRKKRLEK